MALEVRAAAQAGAVEAVARLRALVVSDVTPAAAAVLAARELLDRAYGRALPEEVTSERAVVGDRGQLRARLLWVFWARLVPQPRTPGQEARYRLPDGRVLCEGDATDEVDDWIRVVTDGLFGPETLALPDGRHPDDHYDLPAASD